MPSTIDPSVIDPTKPETYPAVPTTADQRSQHQNIQNQFQNAQNDVNALETSVAGKEDAGTAASEVAAHNADAGAHTGTFDAAGSAAAVAADLTTHEADFTNPHQVSLAQVGGAPSSHVGANGVAQHALATTGAAGFAPQLSNVATEFLNGQGAFTVPAGGTGEANTSSNSGAGVQLAQAKAGVDLPFRTLVSGDASVSFTQNANEIDIRSTGAGGGESNTSTTPATPIGGNEADINMAKNGVDLPKRKLVGGATVTLTQGADSITIASTDGSGAVQANLDTHEGDFTNPHQVSLAQVGAAPSSHVGAIGILTHGLATTGQAGFAPQLSNVATEFLNGTGVFSTPTSGTGDVTSSGTTDNRIQIGSADAKGIQDAPVGDYNAGTSQWELGPTQVSTLESTGLAFMDAAQTTAATTIDLSTLTDNLVIASATGGITINTGAPADPFWGTIVFTDAGATVSLGTGTWYDAAPVGDAPTGAGKVLSVMWDGTSGKAIWVG